MGGVLGYMHLAGSRALRLKCAELSVDLFKSTDYEALTLEALLQ